MGILNQSFLCVFGFALGNIRMVLTELNFSLFVIKYCNCCIFDTIYLGTSKPIYKVSVVQNLIVPRNIQQCFSKGMGGAQNQH